MKTKTTSLNDLLSNEDAALVLSNELPSHFVKPTHSNVLVDIAKRLQRLQTKRAKLKRELKKIDADIKHSKKELRAVSADIGRGRDI